MPPRSPLLRPQASQFSSHFLWWRSRHIPGASPALSSTTHPSCLSPTVPPAQGHLKQRAREGNVLVTSLSYCGCVFYCFNELFDCFDVIVNRWLCLEVSSKLFYLRVCFCRCEKCLIELAFDMEPVRIGKDSDCGACYNEED